MHLQQFHVAGLGCLSYLVGDEDTGEAAIVDPQVDVAPYLAAADEAGLVIRHTLETHLHADHLSGSRLLAAATGATIHMPALARAHFPHEPLEDGATLRLGQVHLRARATPGHTNEHMCFEVVDLARGTEEPFAWLTGDALFVGSVGRPDLVMNTDARGLAGALFDSVTSVLGDSFGGALVYPGHGAGSACGAHMSHVLCSSMGFERASNPFLQHAQRDSFVEAVMSDLPPKPGNALALKKANLESPPEKLALDAPRLDVERFESEAVDGAHSETLVLDTRPSDAFLGHHIPRAVNVSASAVQFANRAARFVESGAPLYLVCAETAPLSRVLMELARVGGLDVRGVLDGGMEAWRLAGKPLARFTSHSVHSLRAGLHGGSLHVLDVRTADEWRAAHIPGSTWIPWESLESRVGELDDSRAWVTVCASGDRSSIAASILERAGFAHVGNLMGGVMAWRAAGFETSRTGLDETPSDSTVRA